MKKLIIATRGSKLALWQSEHVKAELEKAHPGLEVELSVMMTKGDKILDVALAKIGGKGLFTKELEEAMLRGEAHIAVHSLKDVPMEFPQGLKLGVISKREDVRDAIKEPLKEIADALKDVLEVMPPDLAADIVENGVVLTGGGALIRGFDKYLSDIVKLPVFVADEPLLAVAKGTGKALEEIELLQQLSNE